MAQDASTAPWETDTTTLSKIYALDEVVITGTRTEKTLSNAPVLTRVISAKQIKLHNFENIIDALTFTVPGIQFAMDGRGNNIRVQGLENDYILILVDGERMTYTPGGNIDFNRLNLSNVKQIEVIKGASSVLYGSNAIGMIINIITQQPTRSPEGWAKLRYGKYNEFIQDFGVGFAQKSWSSLTTLYHYATDGYNLIPQDRQTYTRNPASSWKAEQRFTWEGKQTRVTLNGGLFFTEEFNPPESFRTQHYKSNNKTLSASVEQDLGAYHTVKLAYFGDFYTRKTVREEEKSSFVNATSNVQSVRLTDQWTPSNLLELMSGLEMNYNRHFSEMQFGEVDKVRSMYDLNAFSQLDWRLLPDLNLTGGARVTHHSAFGNKLTPIINLMYSPRSWRFRTGYSVGFKAPTATELYSDFMMGSVSHNIGNPDLKAEHSNFMYLSAEYKHQLFNVSGEVYQNNIGDKIHSAFVVVTDPSGSKQTELRYNNIDEVRIRGFQLNADLYPIKTLTLHGSYAYTDAQDLKTGLQLIGNVKHSLSWLITYDSNLFRRPVSVSLGGYAHSKRLNQQEKITVDSATGERVTTIEDNPQDGYSIWRANVRYTPWIKGNKELSITLGVDNIFNFTDAERFVTYDPGRRFYASAIFKF